MVDDSSRRAGRSTPQGNMRTRGEEGRQPRTGRGFRRVPDSPGTVADRTDVQPPGERRRPGEQPQGCPEPRFGPNEVGILGPFELVPKLCKLGSRGGGVSHGQVSALYDPQAVRFLDCCTIPGLAHGLDEGGAAADGDTGVAMTGGERVCLTRITGGYVLSMNPVLG